MNNIRQRLERAYDKIVAPKAMFDEQIELANMAIYDEDDAIAGYHSINSLHKELGLFFLPVEYIDERFALFRWSFDRNGSSEQDTIDLLKSKGLLDMRDQTGNTERSVENIDFTGLNGNEFLICSDFESLLIPKTVTIEGVV